MSKTDNPEPRRAKDLTDRDEPRWVNSSTDSENTEPSRAKPSTDTVDPILTNDLIDSDEPSLR
jgi:hypothetical protein